MPKGYKTRKTLEKEAARAALRELVLRELEPLVRAQIDNAKGIAHFFLRGKDGRFERITDEKAIAAALNAGDEGSYYWIYTKDPSVQAFTDLMNRALDKPKEQEQAIAISGQVNIVDLLRQRERRINDSAESAP